MKSIVKIAEQTIIKYHMLESGQKVVVGLSGGPDSTGLLLILLALKNQFSIELILAHLNHKLRGLESDKDENYVRRLAHRFSLPLYCERINVATLVQENKTSLEETAREVRYQFFLKIAQQVGAQRIAVAHTADDQAETMLMRIIYGTGLRGLAGIKPIRDLDQREDIKVIRPLIELSRSQLITFLKGRRYHPRFDSSNQDLDVVRNRIRHDLLPRLEKEYNPAVKDGLCRLSRQLAEAYDCLHSIARNELKKNILEKGKGICVLDIRTFSGLHPALRSETIRLVIEKLKGDLKGVTYQNLMDVEKILQREAGWSCLNLPGGITVTRQYNRLSFYEPGRQPDKLSSENLAREIKTSFPMILKVPGTTNIKALGIKIKTCLIEDPEEAKLKKILDTRKNAYRLGEHGREVRLFDEEYFDYHKLKLPLEIRLKQPGDRMSPLGLKKTKKIKKIFIDRKIPAFIRPVIPLVLSGNKIIWLCGICISDEFKITSRTKKVLKITCRPGNYKGVFEKILE